MAGASSPAKRQLSAPPANTFIRSAHQAAVVIGDFLYIDGGEVSQGEGQKLTDSQDSRAINETLSIPLSSSWSNATVQITPLPKNGDTPQFKHEALWRDPSGNSFYMWGGATSYGVTPPQEEVWQFTSDGSGGGNWQKQAPKNPAFSNILRQTMGSTTISTDTGFYMGGYLTAGTDVSITPSGKMFYVPGIISFNMTTGLWANSSTTPLSNNGMVFGGAADFIPSFGTNGLIAFLGGQGANSYTEAGEYVSMGNITLYDPVASQWYFQTAVPANSSAGIPSVMTDFCTVSAQGRNGTFEIFLYGGAQNTNTFGDVWVLSIPGFFWSKVYSSEVGRTYHTCVLAGKRQMISIGGLDGSPASWTAGGPDPLARGLGVFDLTSLRWSSQFDADADDYQSPDVVNEWYSQGKLSSVQWTSDDVRGLFIASNSSQPTNNMHSSTPRKTNIGAIAGGVVGGILLIIFIVALVWIWRRRQRRKYAAVAIPLEKRLVPESTSWERSMLDGTPVTELHARKDPLEMDVPKDVPMDVPKDGLYELSSVADAHR